MLNNSQQKVFEFLTKRINDSIPPTVREICEETGLKSTSSVHAILKKLEELGLIERDLTILAQFVSQGLLLLCKSLYSVKFRQVCRHLRLRISNVTYRLLRCRALRIKNILRSEFAEKV